MSHGENVEQVLSTNQVLCLTLKKKVLTQALACRVDVYVAGVNVNEKRVIGLTISKPSWYD